MKRKVIRNFFVVVLVLIEITSIFLLYKSINNKETILDNVKLSEISKYNNFALMIEEDGEYVESETFPTSGYVLNETLSGCVDNNGNTIENALTYTNGTINLRTRTNAMCYLYFDIIDTLIPETPTITRIDYNTFSYTSTDNIEVTGYYISKNNETPPTDDSEWITEQNYDISDEGIYRVWARDAKGNISNAETIEAYLILRSQGTGSTLTTRYESTGSNSGIEFLTSVIVLEGTPMWASSAANTGYTNVTLKYGETTLTASGSSFLANSSSTIISAASTLNYTVRVSATSGGTISPSSQSVEYGKSAVVTISPSSGYEYSYYSKSSGEASINVSNNEMTISNITSDVSIKVYFTSLCSCPYGGTLQSDNTCDITTYSSTTTCKWCNISTTEEWCCAEEDYECSAPSSDYYDGHYTDFYSGTYITTYFCYYYDESNYQQSCSECGSTTEWDCSYGSLTYSGSTYGICTYNSTC